MTSSEEAYRDARIDPDYVLFEGLEVRTSQLHMDWEYNPVTGDWEIKPGQVDTVLRVWDCWHYRWGPDDVF